MSNASSKLRKQFKERMDDGETILCALCGTPIPRRAHGMAKINKGGLGSLSMDHIIEKKDGGRNSAANLQPTHQRCNFLKSNRLPKSWRKVAKVIDNA